MTLDTKAVAAGMLQTVSDWISPTIKAIDDRLLGHDARCAELARRMDTLQQRLSSAEKKLSAFERKQVEQ